MLDLSGNHLFLHSGDLVLLMVVIGIDKALVLEVDHKGLTDVVLGANYQTEKRGHYDSVLATTVLSHWVVLPVHESGTQAQELNFLQTIGVLGTSS